MTRVQARILSRNELRAFASGVDIMLYPSRREGFGLSLLEVLHAGTTVRLTRLPLVFILPRRCSTPMAGR